MARYKFYIVLYCIVSESPKFCRRYYKKYFGFFFSGHNYEANIHKIPQM